jgi:hypothetical protein
MKNAITNPTEFISVDSGLCTTGRVFGGEGASKVDIEVNERSITGVFHRLFNQAEKAKAPPHLTSPPKRSCGF